MIQCIECPCGKIFAGAVEPHCYTDKDWQRNMRKDVSKGCKVSLKEGNTFTLENCTCKNMNPANKEVTDLNQLSLF